jgi:hypothetical protein
MTETSRDGFLGDGPSETVSLSKMIPNWRQVVATKDSARLVVLVGLLAAFLTTVVAAFLAANGPNWPKVGSLLDLLLPAETALLGVAVAFYMTD